MSSLDTTAAAHGLTAPTAEDPVTAWRRLTDAESAVVSATRLKKNNRTQVYRLELADASSLIAKRCRARAALLEHAIYSEILDQRRLRAPALYGFGVDPFTDDDYTYYWLFLEDLGPTRHDPADPQERRQLAHWLGTLGALTIANAKASEIPPRLLPHYRTFVGDAAEGLAKLAARRAFSSAVCGLIDEATRTLDRVASGWQRLQALANAVPPVIAHGDCLPKNIHVTAAPNSAVIPIDWGSVGLGLPGADLGVSSVSFEAGQEFEPCIDAYLAAIRPAWPEASAAVVQQLAMAGRVLWASKLLAQSLPAFELHATDKVETSLSLYAPLLTRSFCAFASTTDL